MPRDTSPDQERTPNLLESIATGATHDDYNLDNRERSAQSRGLRGWVSGFGVMLLALIFTIAILQTRTERPVNAVQRDALIADIGTRKDVLADRRAQATKVRSQVQELRKASTGQDAEQISRRILTGAAAASGPGIVITVDSNPAPRPEDGRVTERDLQILINGLWYAGAEAISINGHRLSTMSAIAQAGQSLTVNYRSLNRPYRIVALGNAEQLDRRITSNAAGQYWTARVNSAGLRFTIETSDDLTVPSAPMTRVTLNYASAIEGDE